MTIQCPDCGSNNVEIDDCEFNTLYICIDCGYESYESEDCWEQKK